jgi:hypothetical protein
MKMKRKGKACEQLMVGMESLGTNRSYLKKFNAHLLSVRGLLGGDTAEQGQDPHQLSLQDQGQEEVCLKLEYFYYLVKATEEGRGEGEQRECLPLSAGAYITTRLVMVS